MIWKDLLYIWISDDYTLNIEVGVVIFFILVLSLALFLFFRRFRINNLFFHEVELSIALGGIGDVKIKTNHEVVQVAHKAWSEMITRKAGLQFEPEHDVIVEVYNSWYQLFSEMRALIKSIPANRLKDENTQKLVNLLVDTLNKGLRPHLTKWQARFRRWYEAELTKQNNYEIKLV